MIRFLMILILASMSTITSRIRFEADDSGIESTLSRMESRTKEVFSNIASETEGLSSGDAFSHMRSRVSDAQHSANLRYQESMMDISDRSRAIASSDLDDDEKARLQEDLKLDEELSRQTLSEEKLQSELLRELINSIKATARDEIREDRISVEERVSDYSKGHYVPKSEEERIILEEQKAILESQGDDIPSQTRRWVDVMKGNIAANIVSSISRIPSMMATSSDADEAIASMWGMVSPTLGAASMRNLELREERDRAAMVTSRMGAWSIPADEEEISRLEGRLSSVRSESASIRSSNVSDLMIRYGLTPTQANQLLSMSGAEVNNQLSEYGEISLVAGTNEFEDLKRKSLYSSNMRQIQRIGGDNSTLDGGILESAAVLRRAEQSREALRIEARLEELKRSYDTIDSMSRYGYSQSESISMIADINRAYGLNRGEDAAAALGRDYGVILAARDVSGGTLQQVARGMRTDNVSISQVAGFVDSAMSIGGVSRSRTGEMYENINQLVGAWNSAGVSSDYQRAATVIGSMQAMGGTAMDNAAVMSVHSKLSSGGDAFSDAIGYSVYAQEMAENGRPTSYVGYLKWREKGVGGQGSVQGRLDRIRKAYGTGDLGVMVTKELMGTRSYQDAEDMLLKYDEKEAKAVTDGEAKAILQSEVKVTERQKMQAEITNEFIKGMTDGMKAVFSQIGKELSDSISGSDSPFVEKKSIISWFETMFGIKGKDTP